MFAAEELPVAEIKIIVTQNATNSKHKMKKATTEN